MATSVSRKLASQRETCAFLWEDTTTNWALLRETWMHCFVIKRNHRANIVVSPSLFLCHFLALCGHLVDRNASSKFEISRAGVKLYHPKPAEIPVAICVQTQQRQWSLLWGEASPLSKGGGAAFFLRIVLLGRTVVGLNAFTSGALPSLVLVRIVLMLWSFRLTSTHRRPPFIMLSLQHDEDCCLHLLRFVQLCLVFKRCPFLLIKAMCHCATVRRRGKWERWALMLMLGTKHLMFGLGAFAFNGWNISPSLGFIQFCILLMFLINRFFLKKSKLYYQVLIVHNKFHRDN